MTCSLCFNCGHLKWTGIFSPCQGCGGTSTGNWELDVLFSDHHLPLSTLDGFSRVLRSIHRTVKDPEVRLWAFLYYVSRHHSALLIVHAPPSQEKRLANILEKADLLVVRPLPTSPSLRSCERG